MAHKQIQVVYITETRSDCASALLQKGIKILLPTLVLVLRLPKAENKDPEQSYRPISLTAFLLKT
jgi:hypothetical protein